MADYSHRRIDEIESISGALEGIEMFRVATDMGVESFGISVIDLEPGADAYPEHDHSPDGIGGRMFAERPRQLNQEEIYVALRGSGTIEIDGEPHAIDSEHMVRVGPAHRRKVLSGPDGLRLLSVGGVPGAPYAAGDTL